MESSTMELKRKVGDLIFSVNNNLLELQKVYSKVKDGDYSQLSETDFNKETVLKCYMN